MPGRRLSHPSATARLFLLLAVALAAAALAPSALGAAPPRAAFGGTPPLWVMHPYLADHGGRVSVEAEVFVDPFRRPEAPIRGARHLDATPDEVSFHVAVARRRFADPRRPRAVSVLPRRYLLADITRTMRVDHRGIVHVSIPLDTTTSAMLRRLTLAEQRAVVSVIVMHRKDTYAGKPNTAAWGMTQTNDASLQRKVTSEAARAQLIRFAERQIEIDRRRINVVPGRTPQARWSGESPMYNYVYVTNPTPFQQQVEFNPNLQCMWTGSAQQYPTAQVATVPSGGILQMAYLLEPQPYTGITAGTSAWAGLNGATGGVNAPGTQDTLNSDLVNAATAAGQSLLESSANAETYNEAGAVAAVGAAAVTFMRTFLGEANISGTCNDVSTYPETFGVTTTVTGFGPQGASTAWGASSTPVAYTSPNTWMVTQPIPAPQATQYWTGAVDDPASSVLSGSCVTPNTNGSEAPCYWTGATTVGGQTANSPTSTCPPPTMNSSPSDWCSFVYSSLQPMLGAQTTASYYWNGGQPSYMVSNNAEPGSYIGGAASFQGGLFQSVGPNPGLPGDAWCWGGGGVNDAVNNCSWIEAALVSTLKNYNPMGAMNIQLTYLTTPQYTSGLYTGLSGNAGGQPVPTVDVKSGNSSTGVKGINITCNTANIQPYLSLPFAAGGAQTTVRSGSQLLATPVNGDAPASLPTGQWAVSFYGLDANGNFVYYNANPGQPPSATQSATSPNIYSLGPNASNTTASFAAGSPQYSVAFLPNTVLGNLQTIADMNSGSKQIATLAAVGCTVVPSVALSGLDITGTIPSVAAAFGQINAAGNGWPMPGDHTGWPASLYAPYDQYTNYQWQWPVNQVNVAFQGMPATASAAVSCTQTSCVPGKTKS